MTKKSKNDPMPDRHNGRRTKEETEQAVSSVKTLASYIDPEGAIEIADERDPLFGLTEQQRLIYRMKIRGLSQVNIAKFLNISQPAVSKHLRNIKAYMAERGSVVDQDVLVGESTSLFEEIEYKGWELYSDKNTETGDKLKALQVILQARDKQNKLLMDLGKLEKAAVKNTVELNVSPLIKKWSQNETRNAVESIIESQLSELAKPEPPQLGDGEDSSFFDEIEDS